jgi:hypothetical protein
MLLIRRMCARFCVLILATSIIAAAATGEELKAGMVLNQQTWQLADGKLPPEILKHYKEGDYINKIVSWPKDFFEWPEDFLAASKTNEGKYEIGDKGHVVEKATGKQPDYIIGFPFPTIDENDPKAAAKVMWNFFYRTWYFGNNKNESQVNWVNRKGLERRTDVEASFRYFDGVPPEDREENPLNLLNQFLTVVKSPVDLNGTASLSWRYRDPDKRDSSWSFVPALRRVRAVSPANRSDGFLGSDMSQDDGPFFDGKVEDFTWTLKGSKDMLRFVDPLSLEDKGQIEWLPDGGWRAQWPDLPFIGYMDDDWAGVPWASATGALALRPHWILQAIPKDKYYLYGKMELYVDKITYQGSWNSKYSWKGELLNTYQVMAFNPKKVTRPDGREDWVQGSSMAYQCAENIKRDQATIAGIKSSPRSGFDSNIVFDDNYFEMSTLNRYGK